MLMRFKSRFRQVVGVVATGVLFQAAGCNVDLTSLTNNIANSLVTNFVFRTFNLPAPF